MPKLNLHNKNLFELFGMILGSGLIVSLFILSSSIDFKHANEDLARPSGSEIVEFSQNFLEDSTYADLGKKLDCSGFTKAVFNNFHLQLGASAVKQFEFCKPIGRDEISAGNLVFFITRGKRISHVGILIDNKFFIHSPGKNRFVRIDSFSNTYWNNCFAGAGKIKLD